MRNTHDTRTQGQIDKQQLANATRQAAYHALSCTTSREELASKLVSSPWQGFTVFQDKLCMCKDALYPDSSTNCCRCLEQRGKDERYSKEA